VGEYRHEEGSIMTDGGFAYSHLFAKDLPPPAPRWTGFPKYNFIGGHNDPVRIPAAALAEAATAVLRRRGADLALYNFDGPQGYLGLRQLVVDKVAQRPAIKCTVDDVLITSGSGQAIDLVNGLLLERGDTVILEEFTYGGALTKLKRLGVNVVGAPLDDEGLTIDGLDRIIEDLGRTGIRPKYVYTIPTVQNPTGSILPRQRREALLALTRKHGVPVFEDECYADLTWDGAGPPSLYAMDPQQVIHIGSFSKTLAPSLRLGYVIAVPGVMSRIVACKREADSGTGALDQMVVAEYFSQNFAEHVGGLTQILHDKLDTMVEAVEREFGTTVEKMWRPKGGIFLWLKLPDRIDVTKLVAPAAKAGVVFNPGPEWSCNPGESTSHLRLCFALPSKDDIRAGVAAFARVCFEETGIPERSANIRHAAAEG
jgi:2-aminoadipate transaminase